MTTLKSQLKISLTAQLRFAFLTLFLPSLVIANADKKITEKNLEPVLYHTVEQCHPVLAAYIDWHGRALVIEDEFGDDEYQWFRSLKYSFYLPSMLRNPRVDLDEIYELMIAPEQHIVEFVGLSVVCKENKETSSIDGDIAVKVKLETGVTSILYYGFNSKAGIIHGEKYNGDSNRGGEIFREFEGLPTEDLSRISQARLNVEEELKRVKGSKANNLIFNDDEVEFWFDWPSDTLIKTTERIETRETEFGETTGYSIREHRYESMITHSNEGVRVSELAGNRGYRYKTNSEDDWSLPDRSDFSKCVAEGVSIYCWLLTPDNIGSHYSLSELGQLSYLQVDTLYVDEVEQWMDDQLHGVENLELYKENLRAVLEQEKADSLTIGENMRIYSDFSHTHAQKMKTGEVYSLFLDFQFPKFRYPKPRRPFTKYPTLEARYVGRVPCNQFDDAKQCAKIEQRTKALSPEEQGYPKDVIRNDVQIDFILEPHTLLVHEARYRFSGEAKLGTNSETAVKTADIEISIVNSFETR